ncbi:unnamed protein product [Cuscuta europaea]|uniref:Uncharacterized protein n=1 Tax=Cuscuta europaea TaxID=41803 RepID=A0A9P0ZSG2_CUSEU|nr:unnamed protein product [Cuscuta europaea]
MNDFVNVPGKRSRVCEISNSSQPPTARDNKFGTLKRAKSFKPSSATSRTPLSNVTNASTAACSVSYVLSGRFGCNNFLNDFCCDNEDVNASHYNVSMDIAHSGTHCDAPEIMPNDVIASQDKADVHIVMLLRLCRMM